jgi:hypothetical protein
MLRSNYLTRCYEGLKRQVTFDVMLRYTIGSSIFRRLINHINRLKSSGYCMYRML